MRILFTGGSSFTGFWFVQELVNAGHEVWTLFQKPLEAYQGLRRERVEKLVPLTHSYFSVPFGTDPFLTLIDSEPTWDLFCHHAADVTDYKSPLFDPVKALGNNTWQLTQVLERLQLKECKAVLLTGSVFEPGEGKGSEGLPAVSPYGLSKGLTSELFRYYVLNKKMTLGKFVIANPFGPYEEARFTSYLADEWLKERVPLVKFPDYIRDNVPVFPLAKAYLSFAEKLIISKGFHKYAPSCFAESQGHFTVRFAKQMAVRLPCATSFEIKKQTEFLEPLERVNTDPLDVSWDEKAFWDELATFYLRKNR